MNEARCSVNWKMFAPNGAQMQFTVRDDDPDLHLALLDSYLEALYLRGYSVTEPGLNAGEKQEEINAYVLGESKKGDACVYLYASKAALQWRIATVYVEKFAELPFRPAGKKWEASAAPERAEAEKKGFLTTVPAFKIVLEAQEPDAEGKVHWRFARVIPSATPPPTPAVNSKLVTSEPPPDPAWDKLIPATEERGTPAKPNGKPAAQPHMAALQLGSQTGQFNVWAGGFADIYPYYAASGKPDMVHILRAIASEGYATVTPENLAAVCKALEARAERKVAGK